MSTDQNDVQLKISEAKARYEQKREELEKSLGKKVTLHTITVTDGNGKETGEVLCAYFKQPHLLVAALAMDMLGKQEVYMAGLKLWDACFMPEQSSPQVSEDKYKLGLLPSVGFQLDVVGPDVKKN